MQGSLYWLRDMLKRGISIADSAHVRPSCHLGAILRPRVEYDSNALVLERNQDVPSLMVLASEEYKGNCPLRKVWTLVLCSIVRGHFLYCKYTAFRQHTSMVPTYYM